MTAKHKTRLLILLSLCVPMALSPSRAGAESADVFDPLYSGTAAQAVETLEAHVDNGGGAEHRFALGVAQTCAAIERLTASFNRYGLNSRMTDNLRMLGMPTVSVMNPAEDVIDAEKFRTVLDRFYQDIAEAEQTLGAFEPDGDLKVVLDITRVRLDYDGDGEAGPDEALGRLMQRVQQMQMPPAYAAHAEPDEPVEPQPFPIALDAGDVYWLRGYCHLLMGMGDFILAHDTDEIFDRTAHLFFARVDSPFTVVVDPQPRPNTWVMQVLDMVAFVHLIRLDVEDPERLNHALEHVRQVSKLSRQSWGAILLETDDDREWIPAPGQQSVLGDNLEVDQARIDAWMQFLDEYDAIFAGEKLIPFWRGDKTQGLGVNVVKVFEAPKPFDLVLWIQGSAAVPYLEKGELTTPMFWRQLQAAFRGDFLSFAFIVN